ncbi:MAG TPA: metalloregulator ArsR/SmtB family transcription factor [Saprospiraceae bacterium]|nr:metalloregulator ArsR/SmtB family transcription factor [Saprospiraceae bacterium]
MNKETLQALAETLKSIGHPERIAIMNLICNAKGQRMTVKHIYEALGMHQPIVSRHLGILKRCGILERETQGANTLYRLNKHNQFVTQLNKCLCSK